MSRKWKKCCVCGYDYQTFILDTYEMQIDGADDMCKCCLKIMVEEKFEIEEEE